MNIPTFKLFEDNADYNPQEHAKQLQERAKMNLERYKAAQKRGDNYGIALYKLKMQLDDLDMEKMKVRTAIQKLKIQYKKI